jgi:hypothetical protein
VRLRSDGRRPRRQLLEQEARDPERDLGFLIGQVTHELLNAAGSVKSLGVDAGPLGCYVEREDDRVGDRCLVWQHERTADRREKLTTN